MNDSSMLTESAMHVQHRPLGSRPENSIEIQTSLPKSNLGRGPRRSTVAHVRRKVPIGYNVAPQIRPKVPLPVDGGPIPKPHYLPHPWTRPTYDVKRHPDPIRRFSTMHWTGRRTDARTDRQTDRSSTGKFDRLQTTRATRPITPQCI